MEEHEVYSAIGDDGFTRLAAAFYRQVPGDDILGPIYPAHEGLTQGRHRARVERALSAYDERGIPDLLPSSLLARCAMPSLRAALQFVHRPPIGTKLSELTSGLHPAQRRLAPSRHGATGGCRFDRGCHCHRRAKAALPLCRRGSHDRVASPSVTRITKGSSQDLGVLGFVPVGGELIGAADRECVALEGQRFRWLEPGTKGLIREIDPGAIEQATPDIGGRQGHYTTA